MLNNYDDMIVMNQYLYQGSFVHRMCPDHVLTRPEAMKAYGAMIEHYMIIKNAVKYMEEQLGLKVERMEDD